MIRLFCLLFSICLFACHPMEFDSSKGKLSSEEEEAKDKFQEDFVSSELDMVFVFDARKGMRRFYERNMFGEDFPENLNPYNWQMFYTNTSVDKKLLEGMLQNGGREGCGFGGFAYGTAITATGLFASPAAFPFGLYALSSCLPSFSFRRSASVNGELLPFELNGKKVSHRLVRGDANYRETFHQTVTTSRKWWFSRSYDAPLKQGSKTSFPVSAVLLSLSKNWEDFQSDSHIIYFVVTSGDSSLQDISAENIKKDFARSYDERVGRLHFIPIAIQEDDDLCQLQMKELGVKEPQPGSQLAELAEDMGDRSFSLCSRNLGQELEAYLQTLLHSENEE